MYIVFSYMFLLGAKYLNAFVSEFLVNHKKLIGIFLLTQVFSTETYFSLFYFLVRAK